tara:strand:+ start:897 stop:1049 length:153 start_codon:yes stop_codon:yes gene_type:complete
MFDSIKKEIKFIKSRMNYFGIKNYHLVSILFLEIIGWTLVIVLGYKALNN